MKTFAVRGVSERIQNEIVESARKQGVTVGHLVSSALQAWLNKEAKPSCLEEILNRLDSIEQLVAELSSSGAGGVEHPSNSGAGGVEHPSNSGAGGVEHPSNSGAGGVEHPSNSGAGGVEHPSNSGAGGVEHPSNSGAGGVEHPSNSGAGGVGQSSELASRLKSWRVQMGYTQGEFAVMLGLSRSYYGKIENGKMAIPEEKKTAILLYLEQ